MLREEIARVEEMIDEKLADFKIELIAELHRQLKPWSKSDAETSSAKKEPEKKAESADPDPKAKK